MVGPLEWSFWSVGSHLPHNRNHQSVGRADQRLARLVAGSLPPWRNGWSHIPSAKIFMPLSGLFGERPRQDRTFLDEIDHLQAASCVQRSSTTLEALQGSDQLKMQVSVG